VSKLIVSLKAVIQKVYIISKPHNFFVVVVLVVAEVVVVIIVVAEVVVVVNTQSNLRAVNRSSSALQ